MNLEELRNALRMALQRDMQRPVPQPPFPPQQPQPQLPMMERFRHGQLTDRDVETMQGGLNPNQIDALREALMRQRRLPSFPENLPRNPNEPLIHENLPRNPNMRLVPEFLRQGDRGGLSDMDMQRLQQQLDPIDRQRPPQQLDPIDRRRLRPATEQDLEEIRRRMQGARQMPPTYQPPRYPLGMSYPVQR